MSWEFESSQAIYPQIIAIIKRRIVSGIYQAGTKLPSVRDLAAEAGVNPNTMQRALAELEREKLVMSVRTSGRFITEHLENLAQLRLEMAQSTCADFLQQMTKLGYQMDEMILMLQEEKKENDI